MATTIEAEDFEFNPTTAEVGFDHGLVVTIRLVSEIEERRIQVKNQGDIEKLLEARGKAYLVSWTGMTPAAFASVAPEAVIPKADEDGQIGCNAHLKGDLYRKAGHALFRAPIEEAHAELARQYREKKIRSAMQ